MMSLYEYCNMYGETPADVMHDWNGEKAVPDLMSHAAMVADLDANGIDHYTYRGKLYGIREQGFDDADLLTGMTEDAFYEWLQEVAV